ncbi:hypothetical protein, partial [Robiginitalea sp.]|uniref:hypothetical protein n=1 Tax=Robiginitalea sp. TaxID=1902411 RepID=UPI003C41869C
HQNTGRVVIGHNGNRLRLTNRVCKRPLSALSLTKLCSRIVPVDSPNDTPEAVNQMNSNEINKNEKHCQSVS